MGLLWGFTRSHPGYLSGTDGIERFEGVAEGAVLVPAPPLSRMD